MKILALILASALILLSCADTDSEQLYRTKLDNWTQRISHNALTYNSPAAIIDALVLQDEIQQTVPPYSYRETHKYLREGIDLYVQALMANEHGDYAKTMRLLHQFNEKMIAAQNTL